MADGQSASITLTFTGGSPYALAPEYDLAIDAGGDLLSIDAAGDALIVSAGAVAVTWTGTTASFVWPPVVVTLLVGEAGDDILTETGDAIAAET